jgi:nucleoid DNA-binding protein
MATKKKAKKATKKKTTKKKATAKKKTTRRTSAKFHFINELHESVVNVAEVTRAGEVRIKRSDLKAAVEEVFESAAKKAAKGERVRFPVIGALARREVKARKAGKGVNPFTGEPMTIKARPATKKPRWSFPKGVKEVFSNKRNW